MICTDSHPRLINAASGLAGTERRAVAARAVAPWHRLRYRPRPSHPTPASQLPCILRTIREYIQ